MNIEEAWKQMNDGGQDVTSLFRQQVSARSAHSPLDKIKRNLLLNSLFGLLICIAYVIIIVVFPAWEVRACIFIVLVFSLWACAGALRLYRQLRHPLPPGNLLTELERHVKAVKQWTRLQERVALLIYPVSAAGGFMLGGMLGSGKPVRVFLDKPLMQLALLITILILVPLCYYLARWMNRKAFGRYVDQLSEHIQSLQSAE